jgi:predicted regulator of Ras-like GTPase activity (Roadblock/LC7/MglB family)
MALTGDLQHMSVADLIQQYGQDQKTAVLHITHSNTEAVLYFHGGSVAHATLEDIEGEEVVYHALAWDEGEFSLEMDVQPPTTTISRSWSGLLLEGARRLDEESYQEESIEIETEVIPMAKKKSEILADALADMLRDSADIEGVAIVGTDGLVYSANVPDRGMDEDMVGASAATVFGLSNRSVGQLKRGNYTRTLVQGDDGNIIVSGLNQDTLLVCLTPKNVNLGMAFAEVRDITGTLQGIL